MHETSRLVDSALLERGKGSADHVVIRGVVVAELFDEHGNLKAHTESTNLITATGDQLYASRGAGLTSSAVPTGMRLGTGSTAVAKTGAGAAVVSYLSGSNRAFDATFPSASGGVTTYKCTWAAGVATTASPITEAVVNTDTIANDNATTATAANTVSRVILAGIGSKGSSDTLTLTWTHTILGA